MPNIANNNADIAMRISLLLYRRPRKLPRTHTLLTRADAAREISKRKREIQQLERLKGSKIVVAGGKVITCYHATKDEQKRTLRRMGMSQ